MNPAREAIREVREELARIGIGEWDALAGYIEDIVLPDYLMRQRESGVASMPVREPVRSSVMTVIPARKASLTRDNLDFIYNVMSEIPIIEFPDYDSFSNNPSVQGQAVLIFSGGLPSIAYIQRFASDPISISQASLDYYKVLGRILNDLEGGIRQDSARIKEYAIQVQNAQDKINNLPAAQGLMMNAATVEEKYVQLALQVLELFEQIAMQGEEKVFSSLFFKASDEIGRRNREQEDQQETRAEWENEEENKLLVEEAIASKEKWERKKIDAIAQVEETFRIAREELGKQLDEHFDLLKRKYDDLISQDVLNIQNEYKEKELQCERKILDEVLVEKRRSEEQVQSSEIIRQRSILRVERYRKMNELLTGAVQAMFAGQMNGTILQKIISAIQSFHRLENESRIPSPSSSQDYGKVEDLQPPVSIETTASVEKPENNLTFADFTTQNKSVTDEKYYTS